MAYPMQSNYPPQDPSSGYSGQPLTAPAYPSEPAKQVDTQGYPWGQPQQQGYPPAPYTQQPGYPVQYPPKHDPSGERINIDYNYTCSDCALVLYY